MKEEEGQGCMVWSGGKEKPSLRKTLWSYSEDLTCCWALSLPGSQASCPWHQDDSARFHLSDSRDQNIT